MLSFFRTKSVGLRRSLSGYGKGGLRELAAKGFAASEFTFIYSQITMISRKFAEYKKATNKTK